MTGCKEGSNAEAFPGHGTSVTPYCSVAAWRQDFALNHSCDHIERTELLNMTELTQPSIDVELRL